MLTSLTRDHAAALERFLTDFDPCPHELHGYFCGRQWPIGQVVEALDNWSAGKELGDGWVPCSTWFWAEDGELTGVINVRHHLTPQLSDYGGHIGYAVAPSHRRKGVATRMLAETLSRCAALGIQRALLTCDSANLGSRKTIESNGGVLEKEEIYAPQERLQRWYWIDLES